MKLLVVLSLFALVLAVSARQAAISDEDLHEAIEMKEPELESEEPVVVSRRNLNVIQKIKSLWRNATRALGFRRHSEGWYGVLNCATKEGTEMKGCNTFHGPLKCGEAYQKALEMSDLVSDPKLNPMYHDRHGKYPHFHVAGHECVWAEVDCWGNGKKALQWVNPHFWIHKNDVDNCPYESYSKFRKSG